MTFEEGMNQLLAITAKLESGGLTLEEAVSLYGEGAKLADACKKELDQAKLTVSEYNQPQSCTQTETEN
ncbi:MAG: exodeoxyribonuclease VII small subunit [Oscillospiraceae bacterium]|nr:exodeoxyribonuclease VII small subunit [Oscillospiraceae bacterium]